MYQELEDDRQSRVLVYVTGDRPQLETQIHPEVLDHFVTHLDEIGDTKKITLYLYTRGGDTLASWSIANLIRSFCDEFEVVVPSKAHSGGTLISLGATAIMMTKQATLGPIDPSVNGPLNPQIPGGPPNARAPVSVEAINGFVEFAKTELGITQSADMTKVLVALSEKVHPLVLGNVYRTRSQIRMLAERLLSRQVSDTDNVSKILDFLCSESGSHDYTIYRKEARDSLGLNILKPNNDQYHLIKRIYDDIAEELQLTEPFDPAVLLGNEDVVSYSLRRGIVESRTAGSHFFISEGTLTKQKVQVTPTVVQDSISDRRTFEGWRHENV